jgi:hypothetical protein
VATPAFRAREFPPWQGTCWSPAVSTVKSTLPVGVPEPGALAVAVAVKVTFWPVTDECTLADSEVAVSPPRRFRRPGWTPSR